jgi:hypothetical protein
MHPLGADVPTQRHRLFFPKNPVFFVITATFLKSSYLDARLKNRGTGRHPVVGYHLRDHTVSDEGVFKPDADIPVGEHAMVFNPGCVDIKLNISTLFGSGVYTDYNHYTLLKRYVVICVLNLGLGLAS